MEAFGCCSRYVACSDNGACIHGDDADFAGCQYRKNLEAGKIFYGKNAGTVISIAPVFEKIYISCYNRAFRVSRKSRSGFTYSLQPDEVNFLIEIFKNSGIPYKTEISEGDGVVDGTDEEPANSQVIFDCEERLFAVKNFNSWLIKNKYAKGIVNSLVQRDLSARIELVGKKYSAPSRVYDLPVEEQKQEDAKEKSFVQLSLFESA